jgi:putative glycerol-1-phosphate prenyltransferase
MKETVLETIIKAKKTGKKLLAVLLDPDKVNIEHVKNIVQNMNDAVDFIFVGGSAVSSGLTDKLVKALKVYTDRPVVLFPGDHTQISKNADAILFLSLLSGNNPDYLINQHIRSVPLILESALEIIPTGYILINGGTESSVQKISKTKPIEQSDIKSITHTALAGMYMGKQLIYLEAGSGAKTPVSKKTIRSVASQLSIPILVGGGIRTAVQLENAYKNGADLVVIGTAFEDNISLFNTF